MYVAIDSYDVRAAPRSVAISERAVSDRNRCRHMSRTVSYAPAMLEMRSVCERCSAPLELDSEAFICSYECTWCRQCAADLSHVCPNCGGELVRRPRRED